jgi:pilus assembly protein CpaE
VAAYKILVIDGDLASRNFVAKILRNEGHIVSLAASGNRGLILALHDAPQLIIADPLLSDLPGDKLAARLRSDPRTAQIPLVALSHSARTARLRSWLESGFDDYLVKSPGLVPLLKASIAELLGGQSNVQRAGGLLITFFSAKGGLGTSSLCANLASCIAAGDSKRRVVVMDLVLPMGSIAEIVGYQGKKSLEDLARLPAAADTADLLLRNLPRIDHWYFRLLAGCSNPESAKLVNTARIHRIVSALKSDYDYVVIDLGRSLSRISLPLLQAADAIVITAGADSDSVRLTKHAWDFLQSKGIEPLSAYVILNRPGRVEGLSKEEAEKIIGLPVRTAMPYLQANLPLANHWHLPYSVKFPTDAGAIILKQTADDLVAIAKHRRG